MKRWRRESQTFVCEYYFFCENKATTRKERKWSQRMVRWEAREPAFVRDCDLFLWVCKGTTCKMLLYEVERKHSVFVVWVSLWILLLCLVQMLLFLHIHFLSSCSDRSRSQMGSLILTVLIEAVMFSSVFLLSVSVRIFVVDHLFVTICNSLSVVSGLLFFTFSIEEKVVGGVVCDLFVRSGLDSAWFFTFLLFLPFRCSVAFSFRM